MQDIIQKRLLKEKPRPIMTPEEKAIINELNLHIENASRVLKIDPSPVELVGSVFAEKEAVKCQTEFRSAEISPEAQPLGGFWNPNKREIVVGKNVFKHFGGHIAFREQSIADLIITTMHELRHRWQEKYYYDIFKHSAWGLEVLDDLAEIDADAFSLAYASSDCFKYDAEDFPGMLGEIILQNSLSNYDRFAFARAIIRNLNFGNIERLNDYENQRNLKADFHYRYLPGNVREIEKTATNVRTACRCDIHQKF